MIDERGAFSRSRRSSQIRLSVTILSSTIMTSLSACVTIPYSERDGTSYHHSALQAATTASKPLYAGPHPAEKRGVLFVVRPLDGRPGEIVRQVFAATAERAARSLIQSDPNICSNQSDGLLAVYLPPPGIALPATTYDCYELVDRTGHSIAIEARVAQTEADIVAIRQDIELRQHRIDAVLATLSEETGKLAKENLSQSALIRQSLLANRSNRADLTRLASQLEASSKSIRDDDDEIQRLIKAVDDKVAEIGQRIK